ncbi:DUF3006 domain-containing protein [Alkalihalophilus lindianensis]|uniref:DUF3006 domain-containing protein n=1 Tax=Alkalihalophilus lindianensis TaxID=1630542 RepID=A0ABU3XBF2_9BACI|nr:DUF3006 domain-containing protein [Alkalihalophilus lindianensis]MDV2684947.1 DUF3006 domain-containing protein [Alkalihalophilus lindianensis]
MKAILDRIVDGEKAVLLVGPDQKEVILPISSLPQDALEGDHFQVTFVNDRVVFMEKNQKEEQATKKRINNTLEQLRANQKSKYKRK